MSEVLDLLWRSTLETLAMVGAAALFSGVGGLLFGVLLVITAPAGPIPRQWLHRLLTTAANLGRSVPFIILMVALIPFTRLIVGTSIGTAAAVVPPVTGAIPYGARLAESALLEVDQGVVDTVLLMGASPLQVIGKVYLPEALPSLCRAMTLMTITLISFSAMAGAIGGGGLGDLAIRYGYQRFRPDITLSTVLTLVVLVQGVQLAGDALARRLDHR